MTTTLALAARLRGLDDAVLASVLHERTYRRTGVADFFDLAAALLDPDSLQRALAPLDRSHPAVLVVLGRAATPLTTAEVAALLAAEPATAGIGRKAVAAALDETAALLLAEPAEDAAFGIYEAVTAQLDGWPAQGLPSTDELLHTPPPPALAPVPDTERRFTDRLAAERAFEAVAAVSELLAELAREGARRLQKGGLALPAVKRLAEALSLDAE